MGTADTRGGAVTVVSIVVLAGAVYAGAARAAEVQRRTIEYTFTVPSSGRATFGPDGNTRLLVSQTQVEVTGSDPVALDRMLPMPAGTTDPWCEVRVGEATVHGWIQPVGCVIVGTPAMVDQTVHLSWGWSEPHAPAAGVIDLQADRAVGEVQVRLIGAETVAAGAALVAPITLDAGVGFRAQQVAARPVDDMHAVPAYTLAWRVSSANGSPVIPSRDALITQVEQGGLAASLPEPGVGLDFKGRKNDAAVIPELLAKVRNQVATGTLADAHPLKPRKLMAVRRSRWASPWEQSLLLVRYLGQLKIPAQPIPVRPRAAGFIEPAVPVGYDQAVVRVDIDGERLWLDPACPVCAVGELRPELWGGQVLAAGMDRLPDPPVAERTRATDLRGTPRTTLELAGAEALRLRLALADVPLSDRAAAVPQLLGMDGAELIAHEGITERGAPIRLDLRSATPPDPWKLPVVARHGSPEVDLGAPSRLIDRWTVRLDDRRWSSATSHQIQHGPLTWSRAVTERDGARVIEDKLEWSATTASRADAFALFEAVRDIR